MTPNDDDEGFGVLQAPATLTLRRVLPGPVERVWSYLTEGELRRRWLAAGDMDLQAGAAFELVWRNDELSDSAAARPAGFAPEQRMVSRIIAVDPPHRLTFTWQGSGEVCFELTAQGDQVLLTVTHHRLPDRPTLTMVAAGWHMHLDLLRACLAESPKASFWQGWARLRDAYDARLPASAGMG